MNQDVKPYWLPVEWEGPANIKAFYTTRYSINDAAKPSAGREDQEHADYSEFNLALHVGDKPNRVIRNRDYLRESLNLPTEPAWLNQTHSTRVINLDVQNNLGQAGFDADGSFTESASKICCVMTADCLPVLLSNRQGSWVSAVHAGWRGLANGIIENAIRLYNGKPDDLVAWLGPAISQAKFEIGAEVKQIFINTNPDFEAAFVPTFNDKYLADLYQIASRILSGFDIETFGGNFCTFQQEDKFFSYRRQQTTGRMASLIWINNQ